MGDAGQIELERVGDGERWRVRTPGKDVEGHKRAWSRFVVEDEYAEDHMPWGRFSEEERDAERHARIRFSLEPTGEEEGGDPVYRVKAQREDAEGHAKRFFGLSGRAG
jgi:hypothetical protein